MSTLTRALSLIDPDELVALTRDLVRIPSVFRPGDPTANEAAVAAHVEGWLRAQGFEVEIQPVAPGRANVLGILDGAAPRGACPWRRLAEGMGAGEPRRGDRDAAPTPRARSRLLE